MIEHIHIEAEDGLEITQEVYLNGRIAQRRPSPAFRSLTSYPAGEVYIETALSNARLGEMVQALIKADDEAEVPSRPTVTIDTALEGPELSGKKRIAYLGRLTAGNFSADEPETVCGTLGKFFFGSNR